MATLGLKRGLAQQLANTKKPQACVVADAMLVAAIGSALGDGDAVALSPGDVPDDARSRHGPAACRSPCWRSAGPTSRSPRWLIATTSARPSARGRSSSRGRSASSLSAGRTSRSRDGLIVAYVVSMVAALVAALIPLVQMLWRAARLDSPTSRGSWRTAWRNMPLAAADAVEWASRRIDLAVLGAFMPARFVGIYYVAQQVATLPAKLKTSFEPVLGPRSSRKIAAGDRPAVAKQVRQVDLLDHRRAGRHRAGAGDPGRAVMGLVGSGFTGGTATLALPARRRSDRGRRGRQRSRADLRRAKPQHDDQPGHAGDRGGARRGVDPDHAGRGLAAGIPGDRAGDRVVRRARPSPRSPSRGCSSSKLGEPVSGWRWDMVWATAAGRGRRARRALLAAAERWQLVVGIPAILVAFVAVLWTKGFGPEDRELFRMRKDEVRRFARPRMPRSARPDRATMSLS